MTAQSRYLLYVLLCVCAAGIRAQPYDYPFVNGFESTVVGTPPYLQADLPKKIPVKERELEVFEDRVVPEVFWYTDRLKYTVALQDRRAPLIFLIAGTGSDHAASKVHGLQKAFYQAGFHTVTLPSPTHPNFIVSASSTSVPGQLGRDAEDLYRVMRLIYDEIRDDIEVSSFHLTGYSLGASNAVFVAKHDSEQRVFNFERVLMINPPVSLYASVKALDNLIDENLPGGWDDVNILLDDVLATLSDLYLESDDVDFDDDFLYEVYTRQPPSEERLATFVGLVFRFASTNLVFAADVMTNTGYVVPKNRPITASTSLTNFFLVTTRVSFADYVDEFLFPFYNARDPSMTIEAIIEGVSLKSIESYIVAEQKVGLLTNEDDVILAPGDIEYLKRVFGARAQIYPTGGHLGNLLHNQVIAYIVDFFTKKTSQPSQ